MNRLALLLLTIAIISSRAAAQDEPPKATEEPPKASDCDLKAPAALAIGRAARLKNRLRPGGWVHWQAADHGEIVCLYKDKYLKVPGELQAVKDDGDDVVLIDAAGDRYRVLKSRMLLSRSFRREEDAAAHAWLTAKTEHERPMIAVALTRYSDASEDQETAAQKAIDRFLAGDGTDSFRGEGRAAKKRRACLESFLTSHVKSGAALYPTGSPIDESAVAEAAVPGGAERVVAVNGELYVKRGADDLRPCP